ncbi:hypothetical protein RJT34_30653 [Clitoria ternatea]|uniref:Uncharacterized protein n=1 Tax=Clitoria ternatea TaxID=43366 RepID=A0AAN9EST9_CLITE
MVIVDSIAWRWGQFLLRTHFSLSPTGFSASLCPLQHHCPWPFDSDHTALPLSGGETPVSDTPVVVGRPMRHALCMRMLSAPALPEKERIMGRYQTQNLET